MNVFSWRWSYVGLFSITLILTGSASVGLADDALVNPLEEASSPTTEAEESVDDLLDLNLDQLANTDVVVPALDTVVNSVSRQESTVGKSPAAIFVITSEMIQRSGARNIPDILRMAPGVHVSRINANSWGISVRHSANYFQNRLLVQIDGRSIYHNTFAGVYWEMHDLVLEDIERIEVIRGPGASMWGANAVSGVINIITKNAKDTEGLLVVGGAGTEERGFSTVRYGGQVGDDLHWRAYGKQFERDGGDDPSGLEFDDWRQARMGFRADWTPSESDTITWQGDVMEQTNGRTQFIRAPTFPYITQIVDDFTARTQYAIFRWTHQIDDDSNWVLQAYYDHWQQNQIIFHEEQTTVDLDFQHLVPLGQRHRLIWGLGYRNISDNVDMFNPLDGGFHPPHLTTQLYSAFLQDEFQLVPDRCSFTLGTKLQHNDFTGFEVQPTARLLYLPSERQSAWLAVSRAVRTPARADRHIEYLATVDPALPLFARSIGNDSTRSEDLVAYEIGYRSQPRDDFFWDITAFYHQHNNVLEFTVTGAPVFDPAEGGFVLPIQSLNAAWEDIYGAELNTTLQLNPCWEIMGSLTVLIMETYGPDTPAYIPEDWTARERVYLRSSWELPHDWKLDLIGRYVDHIPAHSISSAIDMDAQLAWKPRPNLEWTVVGRNLLHSSRYETKEVYGVTATKTEREIFTTLTWTY